MNQEEERVGRGSGERVRWEDLPQEIIRLIARTLDDRVNFRNFRATCKKWWRSTATSALLPYNINGCRHQKLYSSSILPVHPPASSASVSASASQPWMVAAVEHAKGTTELLHPFSGSLIPPCLPNDVQLLQLKSFQLAVAYHIGSEDDDEGAEDDSDKDADGSHSCDYDKVMVFPSSQCVPSMSNCALLALHGGGRLGGCVPFDEVEDEDEVELPWIEVSQGRFIKRFDDIVMYKGMICALDRQGRVHVIKEYSFDVDRTLVESPKPGKGTTSSWRMRLVGSVGKLYIVVRTNERVFKVYKLHESRGDKCSKVMWAEVKNFKEKVLFVTRDYCFFASASWFPSSPNLGNCIVFSKDAFPKCSRYRTYRWEFPLSETSEQDIQVFRLGGKAIHPISSFPGFPMSLWTPPRWLSDAVPHPVPSHSDSESEREPSEDGDMQCDQEDLDIPDISSPSSFGRESEQETAHRVNTRVGSTTLNDSETGRESTRTTTITMNDAENIVAEGPSRMKSVRSIPGASSSSATQRNNDDDGAVEFEGFDIRSSFVPTLQKIWLRYGNIAKNTILRDRGMIARMLESLVSVVLTFQGHTAQNFSRAEADNLISKLIDLRSMKFEVEWLVRQVEDAVLLKSFGPALECLKELRIREATVAKQKSVLLDELIKVEEFEKELKKDVANLSQVIPFLGEVDLDQPLGSL